jgi:hypothetical protein
MTVIFEASLALDIACALFLASLTGCASRELMNPEPTSLSLSGASVESMAPARDGGTRPESELLRDRHVLGGTSTPRSGAR